MFRIVKNLFNTVFVFPTIAIFYLVLVLPVTLMERDGWTLV
jgi:hypothetical protein